MEFPREITVIQAVVIQISTMIGVGILSFPRIAVDAGGTGAPFVTLMGMVVAFFGLLLITILGTRFPEQSVIRYSEVIAGKFLGRVGSLLIISYFLVITGLNARLFSEVVNVAILKSTPIEMIVLILLLLAAISARNDIKTFAYIHLFYLPFIPLPGLLIFTTALKNADWINLQPLWGNQISGMGMLTGILSIAALCQGSFVFTMVIPSMRRPQKAMQASIWGMSITAIAYIIVVAIVVAVFGPEETMQLLWPTFELARNTFFPANVLERMDVLFLIGWLIVVYTTLYSNYFLTVRGASELFRLRDDRMLTLFGFPFAFWIAMLPQNVSQLYQILGFVGISGFTITIIYPLILLVVAVIRKKKGRRNS